MTMDNLPVAGEPADEADDDKLPDAPGSPLPKKQKNDPDSWNVATSCFDVVKYFAREGITDEDIKKQLILYRITTLETLKRKMFNLDVINKDIGGEIFNKIDDAMERTKTKPAEILGGELELDTTCITKDSLRLYAPEAVSIHESPSPPDGGNYERVSKFTLVMGPSGSGKTMFSLECLPETVYPGAISDKKSFRIHLKASALLRSAPDAALDLPGQVVKYVTDKVARRLSATFGKVVIPIDLFLIVVIDEAGASLYSTFFDSADKINAIAKALENMDGGYKFEKGVHVVVAGTCLETTTKNISSCPEAIKIHMQPLSFDHFSAMLRNWKRNKDELRVEKMVKCFPVLSGLATNARCAYLLARLIPDLSHTTEQRWVGFVDVTVENVSRTYVYLNALSSLSNTDDKFIVVQEAFKALDNAMALSTDVSFPTFVHIKDKRLRSVTQSLLDIHVETIDGKATLIGPYSVSMTPAIAIVLVEYLCGNAGLSWNWQGVDTAAVALGEWKRMITRINVSEFASDDSIIYTHFPVLQGSTTGRLTLPVVNKSTVLVQTPSAVYADIMAPFRLLRTEFSGHKDQDQMLDFQTEIGELGLTTDCEHRPNQAVTSVLYVMWQQLHTEVRYRVIKNEERLVYGGQESCEHYPFQALPSLSKHAQRTARFLITNGNKGSYVLAPNNHDPEATALLESRPIDLLEDFSSEQPVTAVFVTNCKRFVLLDSNGKTMATIAREDVDWQGKLKSKTLPQGLVSNLRKHVDIAFMFY